MYNYIYIYKHYIYIYNYIYTQANKRGCHGGVVSVGNYLHAAITLNDINYNGSPNGWNHLAFWVER